MASGKCNIVFLQFLYALYFLSLCRDVFRAVAPKCGTDTDDGYGHADDEINAVHLATGEDIGGFGVCKRGDIAEEFSAVNHFRDQTDEIKQHCEAESDTGLGMTGKGGKAEADAADLHLKEELRQVK